MDLIQDVAVAEGLAALSKWLAERRFLPMESALLTVCARSVF